MVSAVVPVEFDKYWGVDIILISIQLIFTEIGIYPD